MSRYSGSAQYGHTYWDPNSTTVVTLDFKRSGTNSELRASRQVNKDSPSEVCEVKLLASKTREVKFPISPLSLQSFDDNGAQFRREFSVDVSKAYSAFMDNWRKENPHLANIRDVDQPDHNDMELFGLSVEKMCRALESPDTVRSVNAPSGRTGIVQRVKSWVAGR